MADTAVIGGTATTKQNTPVQIDKAKLEWSIEKFDQLMKTTWRGKFIRSRIFGNSDDVWWVIRIYPNNGNRKKNTKYVRFMLFIAGCYWFKASITAEYRIVCSTPTESIVIGHGSHLFKYVHFVSYNISHINMVSWLHLDGSLKITCVVGYVSLNCHLITEYIEEQEETTGNATKQNIYDRNLLSDFVIKVGRDMLNCHRFVLASHSAVFRRMFEQKTTIEACSGVVEINDSSPTVVHGLLEFMYTGQVNNLNKIAEGLLIISEKYDVSKLKRSCERQLASELSANNVCQFLVSADMHSADHLKQSCLKFLLKNHTTIMEMDEWKTLKDSNPRLSSDIAEWVLNGGKGSLTIDWISPPQTETKFKSFQTALSNKSCCAIS